MCLLWDWISETRLAAKGKEGGERKEGRRRNTGREGCCYLDFVVFPVDVTVKEMCAHSQAHTLCEDQSHHLLEALLLSAITTSSSIIRMTYLVYN